MSRLFIALYLDEDVDVLVAELLRAYGFDVCTTREAGLLGKDDEVQLAYAANHDRALLTHNRVDFERLAQEYVTSGREHHGIIFAVRRPPQEIARRLMMILNQFAADELQNQVRYV